MPPRMCMHVPYRRSAPALDEQPLQGATQRRLHVLALPPLEEALLQQARLRLGAAHVLCAGVPVVAVEQAWQQYALILEREGGG
jgi:hypothetical protein